MPDGFAQSITNVSDRNKAMSGQGMIVQGYCNSVLIQPNVDLSGFESLAKYQTDINEGLGNAKLNASHYLNQIQPMIIANISNIDNYFSLLTSIPATLPPGSTKKEWLDILSAIREQAEQYELSSAGVVTSLQTLHGNFAKDATSFSKTVMNLNAAVDGDNGVLADIKDQVSSIDTKIGACIAGLVVSGLAVAGGVFMILVGTVATFVTAGTSAPLAVGGVGVVLAGVAGAAASGIIMKGLYDAKAELLKSEAHLKSQVKLATGISTAFTNLSGQLNNSLGAVTEMKNAWGFLTSDIGVLAKNLDKGITNTDAIRRLFLTAADKQLVPIKKDIVVIKEQMTGVRKIEVPAGQTVGQATYELAQKEAA